MPETSAVPVPDSPKYSEILLYFGILIILVGFILPDGALVDIPTSFMLKHSGATASDVSQFRFITPLPVYLGFIFGLIRDRWNPLGLRDRGYLLIFSPLTAAAYIFMAVSRPTILNLYIGLLLAMSLSRLVSAAYQGLISLVAQENLMTGRLATLWNIALSVVTGIGFFVAGKLSDLPARTNFIIFATMATLVGLLGLWRPKSIFQGTYERPEAREHNFFGDVQRLVKHWAIYPAVGMCFLWNFAPGSATPLQYYITNTLHASDETFGNFNCIFALSFIPTYILYGYLCKRWTLKKLLWVGTLIGVPQMIPLLFLHNPTQVLIAAVPIGLMGGLATAAYYDLAMRSCPAGLQGTLMMIVTGVFALSARGGDVLGSKIFELGGSNGFLYCVIAICVVYALILPLILLVPKGLIETTDGEANSEMAA